MKFLIISSNHTGEIIYKRLEQEGNECLLFNPYHKDNGISAIASLGLAISKKPDLAIICNTGFTREAAILQNAKINVLGGTQFQDKLELDRLVLQKLCKMHKIRLLKVSTKVECPLSVEVWFSLGEPLYQYFSYIKQEKFLAGDLGPTVDCESIVYWGYDNRDVEIVNRIFEHGLFDVLKLIKYSGVIAFDTFISKDDLNPYVYAARCYQASYSLIALLEIYDGLFGRLLFDTFSGIKTSILVQDKLSLALTISIPPYPYSMKGFVKYLVASNTSWLEARNNLAQQIKELNILQLQYRIDGGMQGQDYNKLKEMSYLN